MTFSCHKWPCVQLFYMPMIFVLNRHFGMVRSPDPLDHITDYPLFWQSVMGNRKHRWKFRWIYKELKNSKAFLETVAYYFDNAFLWHYLGVMRIICNIKQRYDLNFSVILFFLWWDDILEMFPHVKNRASIYGIGILG